MLPFSFIISQTVQKEAAASGLHSFLNKIPVNDKIEYGFDSKDVLADAYLGEPMRVAAISTSKILNFTSGEPIDSIKTETDMWYFPVLINNNVKAILVVDKVNNRWSAVSLGYARLAKEIGQIKNEWKKSDGYTLNLFVNFNSGKYMFSVPEAGKDNLTIINYSNYDSKSDALYFNDTLSSDKYKTLKSVSKTIENLKSLLGNKN